MQIATRLDHAAIAVTDVDAAVEWYGKVLGFVLVAKGAPGQKACLIGLKSELNAGMMIEVMQKNDSPAHARNVVDPGLSHLAFSVSDFDAALAHLKSSNVKFLGDIVQAVGGGRLISFADPDGIMLQIVERK